MASSKSESESRWYATTRHVCTSASLVSSTLKSTRPHSTAGTPDSCSASLARMNVDGLVRLSAGSLRCSASHALSAAATSPVEAALRMEASHGSALGGALMT
eukprot:7379340-Prymnesium_polylepis.1